MRTSSRTRRGPAQRITFVDTGDSSPSTAGPRKGWGRASADYARPDVVGG